MFSRITPLALGQFSTATGTYTVEKNKVSRFHNNNTLTYVAVGINLAGGNNHAVKNNFVFDIRKTIRAPAPAASASPSALTASV